MLRDLLLKTRSYRNFVPGAAVTEQTLTDIIEMTRYTPSTANTQPVKYTYAYTPGLCKGLFELLGWAGYIKENKPPYPGNEPTAYIMLCWDKTICNQSPEIDVGICAQTVVLAAAQAGLGACMIGSFDKELAAKLFKLPENIVPRLVIALGKPNEKIVLTDCEGGQIRYYRDEKLTHYVPKRTLEELIIAPPED